jgi:hypothetical protein
MSNPNPPTPKPRLKLLPDWVRVPGTERQYRNVRTGEVLSRRQYDNKYGRIARSGFRTEYQQRKAEANKWKSFYTEHFPVGRKGLADTWDKLLSRCRELGHRRMFVSAYGVAGTDYPDAQDSLRWVSSTGFYGDAIFGVPGIAQLGGSLRSVWLWDQLTNGPLIGNTIIEFVLRWQQS